MSQAYTIRTDRNFNQVGTLQQKTTAFRPGTGSLTQAGHIYYLDSDCLPDPNDNPTRKLYICDDELTFDYVGLWSPAIYTEYADKPQSVSIIFSRDGRYLHAATSTMEWTLADETYYRLYWGKYDTHTGQWLTLPRLGLVESSSVQPFNFPDIALDGRGLPMIVVKRTEFSELYYTDASGAQRVTTIAGHGVTQVVAPTILVDGHHVYVHAETSTQGYLFRFSLDPNGVPMPPASFYWQPLAQTNMTNAQLALSPEAIGIIGRYDTTELNWLGFRKWESEAMTEPEIVEDMQVYGIASYGLTYRVDRWHAIYTTFDMNEPRYLVRDPETEEWGGGEVQPPLDSEPWGTMGITGHYPNPVAMNPGTLGFVVVEQDGGTASNLVKYLLVDNWYDPPPPPTGTYWPHGGLVGNGCRLGFDINGGAAHFLTGPLAVMDLVEIGEDLVFTGGSTFMKFTGEFKEYYGLGKYACTTLLYTSGSTDAGIPQNKLCEWAVADFEIVEDSSSTLPSSLLITISNEKGDSKMFYLTRATALKPFRVNLWGRNFKVRVEEISPRDAAIRSVELQGKYFGGVN
jgi:hypothetical protein